MRWVRWIFTSEDAIDDRYQRSRRRNREAHRCAWRSTCNGRAARSTTRVRRDVVRRPAMPATLRTRGRDREGSHRRAREVHVCALLYREPRELPRFARDAAVWTDRDRGRLRDAPRYAADQMARLHLA